MAGYQWRRSALEDGVRQVTTSPDGLVERAGDTLTRLSYRDLESLQIAFAPTRYKRNRYVVIATSPRGQIRFENTNFVRPGMFDDRSAAFSAFVRLMLSHLEAVRPDFKIDMGERQTSYSTYLILAVAGLIGAVAAMAAMGIASGTNWVRIVVIAALLPALWKWLRRARPRRISVSAFDASSLPRGGTA